jgi:hypothetical protein
MRKNKYNALKTTCKAGHLHDSRKEAHRCNELHLMWRAELITEPETQFVFELLPKFTANGERVRPLTYRADFVYFEGNRMVIEDVKGTRTKEYLIKKKLLLNKLERLGEPYLFQEI